MYGLKLEHPQAQPNCTCSYKQKSESRDIEFRRKQIISSPSILVFSLRNHIKVQRGPRVTGEVQQKYKHIHLQMF